MTKKSTRNVSTSQPTSATVSLYVIEYVERTDNLWRLQFQVYSTLTNNRALDSMTEILRFKSYGDTKVASVHVFCGHRICSSFVMMLLLLLLYRRCCYCFNLYQSITYTTTSYVTVLKCVIAMLYMCLTIDATTMCSFLCSR